MLKIIFLEENNLKENNGKWSVNGRDLGVQTGGHVLKFWKNKEIHIFQKLIILLSKLLVMILLRGISCYHLPEVVTKESIEKNVFRGRT